MTGRSATLAGNAGRGADRRGAGRRMGGAAGLRLGRAACRAACTIAGIAMATLGIAAESGAVVADGLAARVTIEDGGIAEVLPGAIAGDPSRGREIVANRQVGLCLLCHPAPIPEERFQGDLAVDLAGVGERACPAQLRLRIADASRLNPETIMPSYFRVGGLNRVATAYQGKPILDAQQIEDVVAWLATLREPPGDPSQPQSWEQSREAAPGNRAPGAMR